jgi:hypothetical protein
LASLAWLIWLPNVLKISQSFPEKALELCEPETAGLEEFAKMKSSSSPSAVLKHARRSAAPFQAKLQEI